MNYFPDLRVIYPVAGSNIFFYRYFVPTGQSVAEPVEAQELIMGCLLKKFEINHFTHEKTDYPIFSVDVFDAIL